MKRMYGFCLILTAAGILFTGADSQNYDGNPGAMIRSGIWAAPAAADSVEKEGPDPGMCLFCHAAAVEQWMLSKHYKNEVDCIACHGASEDHIRVEDNTIKPEIYFSEGGKKELEFCRESCHTDLPADPHESHIDDCCSCHLSHDFPSFSVEYFKKSGEAGK